MLPSHSPSPRPPQLAKAKEVAATGHSSDGERASAHGAGTLPFMDPQLWIIRTRTTKDLKLADFFALGMTFYEICTRKVPWSEADNDIALMNAVRDGQFPSTEGARPVRRRWGGV